MVLLQKRRKSARQIQCSVCVRNVPCVSGAVAVAAATAVGCWMFYKWNIICVFLFIIVWCGYHFAENVGAEQMEKAHGVCVQAYYPNGTIELCLRHSAYTGDDGGGGGGGDGDGDTYIQNERRISNEFT